MNYELQRLILQNNLIGSIQARMKAGLIIDLGCGPGITTLNLAKSNPNSTIYGIDFCEEYINYAQGLKVQHKMKNVNFMLHDARNLSCFPSEEIDYVFCHFLFNQLQSPELCLKEIHRVLKQTGKLIIIEGINKQWEWPTPTLEEKSYNEIYKEYQYKIGNNPNIANNLIPMISDMFVIEPWLELSFMTEIPNEIKYKLLRLFLLRMKSDILVDMDVFNKFKERLFHKDFTSYTFLLRIVGCKK